MKELKAITAKESYKMQMHMYRSELWAVKREDYAELHDARQILVDGRLFNASGVKAVANYSPVSIAIAYKLLGSRKMHEFCITRQYN